MRTVVVGLGNPILSDDSVGIKVAGAIREQLSGVPQVEVVEAYAGGLRLMEAISGYDRALIVDAVQTGTSPPGTLLLFELGARGGTRNLLCSHDSDLDTSLALGRDLGLPLPEEIRIIGIEALDVETFGERLSGQLQAALPAVVAEIVAICTSHSLGLAG